MEVIEMLWKYIDSNGELVEIRTTREQDAELIEHEFNYLIVHRYFFNSRWAYRVNFTNNYDNTYTITFYCDNKTTYCFKLRKCY